MIKSPKWKMLNLQTSNYPNAKITQRLKVANITRCHDNDVGN